MNLLHRLAFLGLTFAGLADYLPAAFAQTVIQVPEQVPTIQAAIDQSSAGGIVSIRAGVYFERIDFKGKGIVVRGRDGAYGTVLDGSGGGSVVTFRQGEGRDSVLEGVTLTNGFAVNGGGIFCQFASPTIRDCHVTVNTSQSGGGGIYIRGGQPIITRCRFDRNSAAGLLVTGGGGAYLLSTSPIFTNCIFWDNTSGLHGGAMFMQGDAAIITNCTMHANRCPNEPFQTNYGNCLFVSGSNAKVTNCILTPPGNENVVWGSWGPQFDLSYCNVRGLSSSNNNYRGSVGSVDERTGDVHQVFSSINLGRGTALAPNLPSTDFDGDPVDPNSVDVGADQFVQRLYVHGLATAGGSVAVRFAGPTPSSVTLGLSFNRNVLSPPLPIPGITGGLEILPPFILLQMPRRSVNELTFSIPIGFRGPITFRLQALVDMSRLSDLATLVVP